MRRTTVQRAQMRAIASGLFALAAATSASHTVAATATSASSPAPALHASAAAKKAAPAAPVEVIDINSASRAQLKTLPGIGDAEADKIIAGRPYLSKAELVSKNVLPTGPYLSLKNRIVAMQKSQPKAQP
jgi:competence protein ComEA